MQADFSDLAFSDPDASQARLKALIHGAEDGFEAHLHHALGEAADPDRVLVRIEHFLDACDDRADQVASMAQELNRTRLLCAIFDHSQYLTDIICRKPENVGWLLTQRKSDPAAHREGLLPELREYVATAESFDARCAMMRHFYQQEILRIGVKDVFDYAPVAVVTADLARLAESMLQIAFEGAQAELNRRYGEPKTRSGEPATFVVLGMGKLGGRELNFSSDVDLIFIYSDEGETEGGSTCLSNGEYFHKLGENIIRAMAEQTTEGDIFRVDMRLRPHGRMGALATSIDGTLLYFESQGHAWERQALIKARPVAGDKALGDLFLERTRPFVFPRYFDDQTLNQIRETKQRMELAVEGRGETEREVKLGRGGIRDIEFTVQMLQLLNGGERHDLRKPNTLDTIDALGQAGLLSTFEALTLAKNYAFFRQVEHRLQIEGSRQRHILPEDPALLDDFGRRLGYQSGDAFMVGYRDRTKETRLILERFLATKGSGSLWLTEVLDPDSQGGKGIERLESMGFKEAKRARDELITLHVGTAERPHAARVRALFREVAPVLLESLAASPDPDVTLMRLAQMLANLRAPGMIYDILRINPELCGMLVTLVSNSHFLADFIIRDPGLFETFGNAGALDDLLTPESLEAELQLLRGAYEPHVALYRLRNAQTLRTGMRELLDRADVMTVGKELTLLADRCVQDALERAQAKTVDRFGPTDIPFAILGLGKHGGREMGYGSDLDLVFVYGTHGTIESGISPAEYFAKTASYLIKSLKEHTQYGRLYDVDARLRPDGKKGVLAVSLDRMKTYYRDKAQAWERLALVKARAVAGDAPFVDEAQRTARDCVYDLPLTKQDLESVEGIRKRIVAEAALLDLKKGEGGTVEIEFAVRILQIQHGADVPNLKRSGVFGALTALRAASLLNADEESALKQAYLFFRRVENRIRMYNGRSGSVLPNTAEKRAELASRLGLDAGLEETLQNHQTRVHQLYKEILNSATEKATFK